MIKTIFVNNQTGEKLELINKEGQLYILKNEQGEEVKFYRIVLARHFTMTQIEEVEESPEIEETPTEQTEAPAETITTRRNVRHDEIKILNAKGEELTFHSIKDFANHIETEQGRKINKGHLYNLVNRKSKSYLGYRLAE